MSAAHTTERPRLRADAVRNRERILDAAHAAFVAEGGEVPLDDIARRAGVGNATLYRHFPDRTSLLFHVLLHVKQRIIERAQRLLEGDHDPFEALSEAMLSTADDCIGALSIPLLDSGIDHEHPELVALRERLISITQRLVDRARDSGQLRSDIGSGDLLIAVGRLTRPMPGGLCPGGRTMARRHLQIFLDGLRTPARTELPGPAMEVTDLKEEVWSQGV